VSSWTFSILLSLTLLIIAVWKLIPSAYVAEAGVLVIIAMWVWYVRSYRRKARHER
jgi:hypothetical protein